MAIRRKVKRTERSKLDATPPWETKRPRTHAVTTGPFDVTDAPEDGRTRLDLGTLQIPVSDGIEVRLEVDEQQQIAGVTLVGPTGQMQLGLFAAPRNEGIWDGIRAEIRDSISEQRGTVDELDGEFGVELAGKLPAPGGFTPVRFVAVDGPRWFLRAMLAGAPASDDAEAEPFLEVFRNVVVVRGSEALPVRDPVPLNLPADVTNQLAQAGAEPPPDAT
jgi:Protein of unknown function (DUF3710)